MDPTFALACFPMSLWAAFVAPPDVMQQIATTLSEIATHETAPDYLHTAAEWFLAAGTVALALFTAKMMRATVEVAERTRQLAEIAVEATVVADLHHQEAQGAIVVWDGDKRTNLQVEQYGNNAPMLGAIRNIGFGPAIDINRVFSNSAVPEDDVKIPYDVLAIDGKCAISQHPGPIFDHFVRHRFTENIAKIGSAGVITIEYMTAYLQQRSTTYHKIGEDGNHRSYGQESIELNRDERLKSLGKKPAPPALSASTVKTLQVRNWAITITKTDEPEVLE